MRKIIRFFIFTVCIFLQPSYPFFQQDESQSDLITQNALQSGLSNQREKTADIELLRVGTFSSDQIKALSGEKWYGIYRFEGKNFQIILSRLKVTSIQNSALEVNEFGRNIKKVSVDYQQKPLFLFRGLVDVKPGKVETLAANASAAERYNSFIEPTKHLNLILGDKQYRLEASGQLKKNITNQNQFIQNYTLVLYYNNQKQVLASFTRDLYLDRVPGIVWAGDLDRDGSLDLLLDLTDHYVVTAYTLFLSSMAEKGNLVKKVAEFRTTGA